MSVIEVQATRASKNNPKPQGREKYLLTSLGAKSATPFYVGSMLLAFALYLKSVLVPRANASVPPESHGQPGDQPLNPDEVGVAVASLDDVLPVEDPEQGEQDKDPPVTHSSSPTPESAYDFLDRVNPRNFDLVHLPYMEWERRSFMTNGAPVNFSVLPSNDNRSIVSSGGDGGSSGGGHTGGGSQGPDDQDDDDDDDDSPHGAVNRRPVVARPVVLYDQFTFIAVMIAMSDLLNGASDPDGDKLQLRNVKVSSGELVLVDGGYRFVGDHAGPVTISYEISDGALAVLQTASFDLLDKPPIMGTPGDDIIVGTEYRDDIIAGDGNDLVDGRSGDDTILGGNGNDHIVGGAGNDVIYGGYGDDILFGGLGDDMLLGEMGNDRLFGGDGNDILLGGAGDDELFGDAGNDVALGGSGSDWLSDGEGTDHVDGEEGNDILVVSADATDDLFNGGSGIDLIDFSASNSDLVFDLAAAKVSGADTGADQVVNFEVFMGGSGDDQFIVAAVDASFAMVGDETEAPEAPETPEALSLALLTDEFDLALLAADADQGFVGGDGFDMLDYSGVENAIVVNVAEGKATGEDIGTDIFTGIEHFVGGDGNDSFIVGEGAVVLDGRSGNDMFEFLTDASLQSNGYSHHQIHGFESGDWVRMSRYDIFDAAMDALEDAFEDIYGESSGPLAENGAPDEVVPIRVRHEISETSQHTFIEADFDHNDTYEISVQLDGNHHLMVVTNPMA